MIKRSLAAQSLNYALLALIVFGFGPRLGAQTMCGGGTGTACVLTWQNDNWRTGQNLNETSITYQSFGNPNFKFGQLCSAALDGQVYAQPLVVTNVTIPPVMGHLYKSVVYVVTQNDTLYALQGDPTDTLKAPCSILNGTSGTSLLSFLPTGQYPAECDKIGGKGCLTVKPSVGILGTPVINIGSTGTIYLVTETQNCQAPCTPTAFYHYIHALDIAGFTAVANGPVQICKNGCGPYTNSSQFSLDHIQRPGLLYAPGSQTTLGGDYVYAAFSMMDGTKWPWPDGFIVGYKASDLLNGTVYSYSTSQGNDINTTSFGAGIWQGAAAPAFGIGDSTGDYFVFFDTGNGTFSLSTGGSDAGDSLVKISPSLSTPVAGYFTPADQFYRDDTSCNMNPLRHGNDLDYGSGGPMLLPDGELANWAYPSVSGDKEGDLWFTSRTNPGGHLTTCDTQPTPCSCSTVQNTNIIQDYQISGSYNTGPLIHNSPAYWENDVITHPAQSYIYVGPLGSQLTQYPLCGLSSDTKPICSRTVPVGSTANGTAVTFPWGVTPTISAVSAETAPGAIVWVLSVEDPNSANPLSTVPGNLDAFDATTMDELYSSGTCPTRDRIAAATKYSVPTVANGYVYVAAEQGSCSGLSCTNNGTGTFYIFGPGVTGSCQ